MIKRRRDSIIKVDQTQLIITETFAAVCKNQHVYAIFEALPVDKADNSREFSRTFRI
jgi:hypothetical protein